MKTTEKQRLLEETLHDENYAAFRDGLSVKLLAEVRRRRSRHIRPLLALAACLPIAFGLSLWFSGAAGPRVAVVRTIPLSAGQIVRTIPAVSTIVSTSSPADGNIQIVRSGVTPLETLGDQELLGLFQGQPVALVTLGSGERRLLLPGTGSE